MRLGTTELILILAVALVVFGPSKLPELGRLAGQAVGSFKRYVNSFEGEWKEEAEPSGGRTAEAKQEAEAKRDAEVKQEAEAEVKHDAETKQDAAEPAGGRASFEAGAQVNGPAGEPREILAAAE